MAAAVSSGELTQTRAEALSLRLVRAPATTRAPWSGSVTSPQFFTTPENSLPPPPVRQFLPALTHSALTAPPRLRARRVYAQHDDVHRLHGGPQDARRYPVRPFVRLRGLRGRAEGVPRLPCDSHLDEGSRALSFVRTGGWELVGRSRQMDNCRDGT